VVEVVRLDLSFFLIPLNVEILSSIT
jgi:hypothetical protein